MQETREVEKVKKAGGRRQEAGDRRQETEGNFKRFLSMCKTSTPGPEFTSLRRGATPAGVGQGASDKWRTSSVPLWRGRGGG